MAMTSIILSKITVFGEIFKFYYLANDKYVGQRVVLGKYEEYETKLILRQASARGGQAGCVVVDVGANIGYYTLLLAQKVGEKGKVYAFEPDTTNFSILEKNIKANNLKNVIAVNAAVSDKNGESFLYKSGENFGDHRLYKNFQFSNSNFQKIKTIKLDDYFKNKKINLIKIDTQGWEPKVIEGAKNIIKKNKPIIFFEYWPSGFKNAGLNEKKMMKLIKKIYGKIFLINNELNIYSQKNKKQIDKFCQKQKSGYADMWVKNEMKLGNKIEQYRDIRIKKLIKKVFKLFIAG